MQGSPQLGAEKAAASSSAQAAWLLPRGLSEPWAGLSPSPFKGRSDVSQHMHGSCSAICGAAQLAYLPLLSADESRTELALPSLGMKALFSEKTVKKHLQFHVLHLKNTFSVY